MDAEIQENTDKLHNLKETIEHLKHDAIEIQAKARETLGELKDRSQVYQDSARQALDQAAEYCNQNPQKAALIAAAAGASAGLLLGLLLKK
ncbi:MAG: hypothetical protein KDK39_18515 [Leptospiraceae bacterium]|nr:hypothetical protein [Leptospiraceae bacterium]